MGWNTLNRIVDCLANFDSSINVILYASYLQYLQWPCVEPGTRWTFLLDTQLLFLLKWLSKCINIFSDVFVNISFSDDNQQEMYTNDTTYDISRIYNVLIWVTGHDAIDINTLPRLLYSVTQSEKKMVEFIYNHGNGGKISLFNILLCLPVRERLQKKKQSGGQCCNDGRTFNSLQTLLTTAMGHVVHNTMFRRFFVEVPKHRMTKIAWQDKGFPPQRQCPNVTNKSKLRVAWRAAETEMLVYDELAQSVCLLIKNCSIGLWHSVNV